MHCRWCDIRRETKGSELWCVVDDMICEKKTEGQKLTGFPPLDYHWPMLGGFLAGTECTSQHSTDGPLLSSGALLDSIRAKDADAKSLTLPLLVWYGTACDRMLDVSRIPSHFEPGGVKTIILGHWWGVIAAGHRL